MPTATSWEGNLATNRPVRGSSKHAGWALACFLARRFASCRIILGWSMTCHIANYFASRLKVNAVDWCSQKSDRAAEASGRSAQHRSDHAFWCYGRITATPAIGAGQIDLGCCSDSWRLVSIVEMMNLSGLPPDATASVCDSLPEAVFVGFVASCCPISRRVGLDTPAP